LKTEILDVTFGEKLGENEEKLNRTYTGLLQMNQVLAFTHEKLKRFCLKFDNIFKIPYV
jgi:hypothetical protein